ncbi:uncharacterized protein [Palaemon carinicauda]|uniref:uncharacterized protein n=1 Tax=Palaemon carinicauda TaxID=392227 RepID=UPI0035B578B8
MYGAFSLLSLAVTVIAQDGFYEKYGFTKTMATCFGEGIYYDYLAKIAIAQRTCQQLPVSSLYRLDFSLYSNIGYPHHFGGDSSYVPYPSYHPGYPQQPRVPHGYQQLQYRKKRQAEEEQEEDEVTTTQIPIEEQEEEASEEMVDQTSDDTGDAELMPEETQPPVDQEPSGSQYLPRIRIIQRPIQPEPLPPVPQPPVPQSPVPQPPVQPLPQIPPTKQETFFDKYYLLDSINKITASLSNYTCTLYQIGVIDEYLNLNVDNLVNQYATLPINDQFKNDLVDGIYYCRDMSYCLPLHSQRSPLPLNLQRLLMAMECEKETRTNACFKEDLRKNIGEFDLSLFPSDEDQSTVLNKLAAIVTGVDSLNELDIL